MQCSSIVTIYYPKYPSMALFGNSSTPAILHSEFQGELQGTTHDSQRDS